MILFNKAIVRKDAKRTQTAKHQAIRTCQRLVFILYAVIRARLKVWEPERKIKTLNIFEKAVVSDLILVLINSKSILNCYTNGVLQ